MVDGGWSKWSAWSVCGSDCTHIRRRSCDEPSPSHGGRICQGKNITITNCTDGMCNGKIILLFYFLKQFFFLNFYQLGEKSTEDH